MSLISSLTPQSREVLRHLVKYGSITNVEANAILKCRSVSRRITEIKRALPVYIASVRKKDASGQRYVRYQMSRFSREFVSRTKGLHIQLNVVGVPV